MLHTGYNLSSAHEHMNMCERGKKTIKGEILLKFPSEIEWKVPDFFSLPEESLYHCNSPTFPYLDGRWYLTCYPNVGIFLNLKREHSSSNYTIIFRIGIKRADGLEYISRTLKSDFKKDGDTRGGYLFVERTFLQGDKILVASENKITFFCILESQPTVDALQKMHFEGAFKHTKDNSVDSNEHGSKDDDAKLHFTSKIGIKSLQQNLQDVFLREEQSDILLKVKEREFRAHKMILCARSDVFSAMFAHDTLEKKTGIVEITDCEPETFQQFLLYLYSGQIKKVPVNQLFDLYPIADKYNVGELKKECVNFLQDYMTVDTFCDIMSLAVRHKEMALLENGIKYFARNVKKINRTVKWLSFSREHPVECNELYIKALNYRKS